MKKAIFLIISAIIISAIIFFAYKKNDEQNTPLQRPEAGPEIDTGKPETPPEPPKQPGILDDLENKVFPPAAVKPTENWADGYFPQLDKPNPNSPYVTIHTNMGDIKVVLYPEAAPLTVRNFIVHCQSGYYNNTEFHRVVKDFMMQGGDPENNGLGGESIYGANFREELNDHLHHFPGALSMASFGPCQNASQFFIVQGDEFKSTYEEYKEEKYKFYMEQNRIISQLYEEFYDYIYAENPTEQEMTEKFKSLTDAANAILSKGYQEDLHIEEAMKLYPKIGGSPHLDYQFTVFGQVVEGMDVVKAITDTAESLTETTPTVLSTTVENVPDYAPVPLAATPMAITLSGVEYYNKNKKSLTL